MSVYNAQTGRQQVFLNQDEMEQAVLSGSHAFKKGERVNVFSPEGEIGNIPAEQVKDALRSGFRLETDVQRMSREYVAENKGLKGMAKVAGGQFVDELLFGLPEMIFDKTANPFEVAKKEALKKEYEFINNVAGVAGFAGSFVTGGPLFKAGSKAGSIAERIVAEKIGLQYGVSQAGAKGFAKSLLAKAAGTGLEGAIVSSPHALTEMALGDPEAAGESLLMGVGIGALFGVGGESFARLKKAAKDNIFNGPKTESFKEKLDDFARRMGETFTSVPKDNIKYYMENREAVNAAPEMFEIKSKIDDVLSKVDDDVIRAQYNRDLADRSLRDSARSKVFDLKTQKPTKGLAEDVGATLEGLKATLGDLSAQADNALIDSGVKISKKELLKDITKLQNSFKVGSKKIVAGKVAEDAIAKLEAQKEYIKRFDNIIDSIDARDLLQNIREDVKAMSAEAFNKGSGQFSDKIESAFLKFQNGISQKLKGQSPEYAARMAEMAEISQILNKASKKFGKVETGMSTLAKIASGKGTLDEELLANIDRIAGTTHIAEMGQFLENKRLLDGLAKGTLKEADLVPEAFTAFKTAEEGLKAAQEAKKRLAGITVRNSESVIKRLSGKGSKIELEKQIEEIERLAGVDIRKMIKDRNVLDSFFKESTAGARKTLGGAAIGAALDVVGIPGMGAVTGAVTGMFTDKFGGEMLKKILDSQFMEKGALIFSEQSLKKVANKLDEIPNVVKNLGKLKTKPSNATIRALERILDKDDEEDVKKFDSSYVPFSDPELERMNKNLTILVSNPERMIDKMSMYSSYFSDNGAPNIGLSYGSKTLNAVSYLRNALPKPPIRNVFDANRKFDPGLSATYSYKRKADIVANPFNVIEYLKDGTLTVDHVDALKNVYPLIYGEIKRKILETVVSEPVQFSRQDRLRLSLLFGQPLDELMTPENVARIQAIGKKEEQIGQSIDAAQNNLKPFDVTKGVETDTQRIANS